MYDLSFHPRFKRDIKGLSEEGISILYELITRLKENPLICDQLIGDLKDVYRCKLKLRKVDYRLAYLIEENYIKILMFKKRESFYKALKRMIN
ncbi:MAG: hypothetical protein IEMM0008_1481 [bacterium]|nr:MAG: hypothetical protein IEMM0008_1481 [bacterium]